MKILKSKFKHTIVKQSNCRVRKTIDDYKGVIILLEYLIIICLMQLTQLQFAIIDKMPIWLTSYITENRKKPT